MEKRSETSLLNFLRPARSQLTLVVTLIILICFAVSLAFVFTAPHLDSPQRWVLIVFLVLFPILGVEISSLLILRQSRRLAISEKDDFIPWQIMSPENQRRKLNDEVAELAEAMAIPSNQIGDLRSAYIVAEDLILRKIEQEAKASLMRHVSLERMEFDAVLVKQNVVKCIDVTFLVAPAVRPEKIGAVLKKVEYLDRIFDRLRPGTKLVLVLALVTQLDVVAEIKLRSTITDLLSETTTDVEIRLWDFEELQNLFASD